MATVDNCLPKLHSQRRIASMSDFNQIKSELAALAQHLSARRGDVLRSWQRAVQLDPELTGPYQSWGCAVTNQPISAPTVSSEISNTARGTACPVTTLRRDCYTRALSPPGLIQSPTPLQAHITRRGLGKNTFPKAVWTRWRFQSLM
jgi:hypothetical protein